MASSTPDRPSGLPADRATDRSPDRVTGPAADRPPRLTPAQRREILASDPVTGEVGGTPAVRRVLEAKGLAVAYGRVGATYLTEAGRALRARLADSEERPAALPDEGFEPRPGDGPEPADPAARAAETARAWAALLEIRRLTGTPGEPAEWERARPERAVALTLEALGVPVCAADAAGRRVRSGYRVAPGADPGSVRVEWRGPASSSAREEAAACLAACAARLEAHGWEATSFLGAGGVRYLAVVPAAPGRL